jgi:serine/threonine protein kinase
VWYSDPTVVMGDINHAAREELARARALVGSTIAEKFRLVRLLGVGGTGAVYAATNTWTSRRVAVKMLGISGRA